MQHIKLGHFLFKWLNLRQLRLCLTFLQGSDSILALFVLLKRVTKKQTNNFCTKVK